MNKKQEEKKEVEVKQEPVAERYIVIKTDGSKVNIPSCNIPLLELKAVLDMVLALVVSRINQTAAADNAKKEEVKTE